MQSELSAQAFPCALSWYHNEILIVFLHQNSRSHKYAQLSSSYVAKFLQADFELNLMNKLNLASHAQMTWHDHISKFEHTLNAGAETQTITQTINAAIHHDARSEYDMLLLSSERKTTQVPKIFIYSIDHWTFSPNNNSFEEIKRGERVEKQSGWFVFDEIEKQFFPQNDVRRTFDSTFLARIISSKI